MRSILVAVAGLLLLPCCLTPRKSFDHYPLPSPPDFTREESWAALPWKKDSADALPAGSGLHDEQVHAPADVFFIHPTLYFKGKNWNGDANDEDLRKLTDKYAIRHQASIFNETCKVYAPYYRQATLAAFTDHNGDGRRALDTAYADVRRAFLHYVKNWSSARPLVIAAHSQGTFIAQRLIAEVIEADPALRERLVVAYLAGGSAARDMFTTIVPCDSAGQTNCYAAWHTRRWGSSFKEANGKQEKWLAYDNVKTYECVNPLSWKRDSAYAPAALHKGSVPVKFDRIDTGIVDAQCSPQHIIWVHKPKAKGYTRRKNYHILDYNLFYMNVRENVKLRVENFLLKE